MKYIITEEQYNKINLLIKLRRRNRDIQERISNFCLIPRTNYEMVLEMVAVSIANDLGLYNDESGSFNVIKSYIRKGYGDMIKKLLEK